MAMRQALRETEFAWTEQGREAFETIEGPWDACADAMDAPPICDPVFTRCMAESFLTPRDRFSLHTLWQGPRLLSAVPMIHVKGLPQASVSFDNPHCPYWRFPLALDVPGVARSVLEHLSKDADYLVFRRLHPQAKLTRELIDAAESLGLHIAIHPAPLADAFVRLEGNWDSFRKTLSRNLVNDVPRKMRKLEKMGRLDFEIVTSGPTLRPILNDCLELETRGWKGVSGTPILADPQAHRFYTSLAKALGARNRFALYLLKLDGKIIAFEYCVRHRGRIDMLKLSFDPELCHLSPGNVLRWFIFEHELAAKTRSYHLGNPRVGPRGSTWKLRWATDVEPLCALRIYNRSMIGKLAYYGGPFLRDYLKETRAGVWLKQLLRRDAPMPEKPEKNKADAA